MRTTKAIILLVTLCAFSCARADTQTGTTLVQLGQDAGRVVIEFFDNPPWRLRDEVGGNPSGFVEDAYLDNGTSYHVVVSSISYNIEGNVLFYFAEINGVLRSFYLFTSSVPFYVPDRAVGPTDKPWPPTALPATHRASTSFTANWNAPMAAKGFRLDVSTDSAFANYVSGYRDLDVGAVLSCNVTNLTESTTYYYRVRAYNDFGTSDNSGTIEVTTTAANIFIFGDTNAPVWDISGIYQITNYMLGPVIRSAGGVLITNPPTEVVFNQLGLGVDTHGKVTGGGWILVPVGNDVNDVVGGYCTVSGKMSGGGTNTHVNFTVKLPGNGSIAGVPTTCSISAKYNLRVKYDLHANPPLTNLVGTTSGSAHFSHLGNGTLKSDNLSLPLPPGVDGTWSVAAALSQFGSKLFGSGKVVVPNTPTTTLATTANGSISKSGTGKLNLSGYGYSAGTQLTAQFSLIPGATNMVFVTGLNGKVLGQTVKAKFAPQPLPSEVP